MTSLTPTKECHRPIEQEVACAPGEAPRTAPERTTIKAAGVPGSAARKATTKRDRPVLRARRGRGARWDADEVAAHLIGCETQIVRGLARKSPWVGLDEETLASCFGHGAAVIARVAAGGQRSEWRTPKDLEKAQIAAFRHQAFEHWRRVNARSREGDRYTVAFDPERHGVADAPMDRLFAQPDLRDILRDLLAELADDDLRAYWTIILREQSSFTQAGDRLQLSKAEVTAYTRAGRSAFINYLDRRSSGALCVERSLDVLADRAGAAGPLRSERAKAHIESCYACALVHEPQTSAIERGILGLAPTGFVLRLLARAGDVTASPVMRIADTGSGSRAVAAGLAAVAVAGSGVGIKAATDAPREREKARVPRVVPVAPASPVAPIELPAPGAPQSPPPIVEPKVASKLVSPAREPEASAVRARTRPKPVRAPRQPEPVIATPPPVVPGPQPDEFSFERGGAGEASAPVPPRASPAPSSNPASTEFGIP